MSRSKSKLLRLVILAAAIALFLGAWARLVRVGMTNVTGAHAVEFKDAGVAGRRRMYCRGNAVFYGGVIWQFPCNYTVRPEPESRAGKETLISGFNRWDVAGNVVRTGWRLPELEAGERRNWGVEDYLLFAFAPRPDRPDQIAAGVRWRNRNYKGKVLHNEGRERLYFYLLRPDGTAEKFGQDLQVERGEVSGVGWNGDNLEVVVRAESGDARIYSSPAGGDWAARDVAGNACAAQQKCRLEVAFREQNRWQLLYSRVPRQLIEGGDVQVEFWQGAEGAAPERVAVTAAAQLENTYVDEVTKELEWRDETFDASSGNVLARDLSARPFYRENGAWKQLELPNIPGAPSKPRISSYYGASYYHEGDNLVWIPAAVHDFDKYTFYGGRWLTDERRATRYSGSSQEAIKLKDATTGAGHYVVGPYRERWFDEYNANVMPLGGDLLVFNSGGDHVRVNSDLRRTDPLPLTERFDRMWRGNFDLLGGEGPDDYIYSNKDPLVTLFKQASIFIVLLGLPVLLLLGLVSWLRRRTNEKTNEGFWTSAPVRGAAISYLMLCAIFGYHFWILSGYF